MNEHRRYETLEAYTAACKWTGRRHEDAPYMSFHGVDSIDDALQMGLSGWAEGMPLIQRISAAIQELPFDLQAAGSQRIYDVEGSDVDIDAYLLGEPECMTRHEETDAPRFAEIYAHISATANIDTQTMIHRGAAAAAAVDILERNGYRVSVTMLTHIIITETESFTRKGDTRSMETVLKRHDEHMSPSLLAYWLSHPSAARVHDFQHRYAQYGMNNMGQTIPRYPAAPQNAIYIPGLTPDTQRPFKSFESVAKWLQDEFKRAGIK